LGVELYAGHNFGQLLLQGCLSKSKSMADSQVKWPAGTYK